MHPNFKEIGKFLRKSEFYLERTMRMRSVFHAAAVFQIHCIHAAGAIEWSGRMRIKGASTGGSATSVIEFGGRANDSHGGRRTGQVALVVEHTFPKHLMLLLGNRCTGRASSSTG